MTLIKNRFSFNLTDSPGNQTSFFTAKSGNDFGNPKMIDLLSDEAGPCPFVGGSETVQDPADNDSYAFGRGSGQETLYDYDTIAGRIHAVKFGAGITQADVEFRPDGYDLLIEIKDTGETLTIQNWFFSQEAASYRVKQFNFPDGTSVTATAMEAAGYDVSAI